MSQLIGPDTSACRRIILFVWGAGGYGIYAVALVNLGHRFSGSLLLAGNAAFAPVRGVVAPSHRSESERP